MKPTEYKVIYENDNEEYFYCLSFNQCIVTAMYYAYEKGWNAKLKYITDGKTTIKNIVFGYEFA